MKIYTEVVMDIETGAIKSSKSFDYDGPIAECKGGGTSTTTNTSVPDYAYNARMATVAEKQQAQADEYMAFWRKSYKPMEQEMIAANRELIPRQTETEISKLGLERATSEAKLGLLPEETALAEETIGARREEIAAATPAMTEYYKQALMGVDEETRMAQARSDVGMAFRGAESATRRSMGRMGISATGDRAASMLADRNMEQAKATAGAMTGARERAKQESFGRLQGASTLFKGGIR